MRRIISSSDWAEKLEKEKLLETNVDAERKPTSDIAYVEETKTQRTQEINSDTLNSYDAHHITENTNDLNSDREKKAKDDTSIPDNS